MAFTISVYDFKEGACLDVHAETANEKAPKFRSILRALYDKD